MHIFFKEHYFIYGFCAESHESASIDSIGKSSVLIVALQSHGAVAHNPPHIDYISSESPARCKSNSAVTCHQDLYI